MDLIKRLAQELSLGEQQVKAAVDLIDEGNTIPFIARYRKEATGSMEDTALRELDDRLGYLRNLEKRKGEVLSSIGEQGKLTPELEESIAAALEERLGELPPVTSLLDEGLSPEEILGRLLGDMGLEITDRLPARFFCGCDKRRVEKALISIGKQELRSMIDDGKPVEVSCHFCGARYEFHAEELKELMERAAG